MKTIMTSAAALCVAFLSSCTVIEAQADNGGTVNVSVNNGTGGSSAGTPRYEGYSRATSNTHYERRPVIRMGQYTGHVTSSGRVMFLGNNYPDSVRRQMMDFARRNPRQCQGAAPRRIQYHPEDGRYRGPVPNMRSNPAFPDPSYRSRNSGGIAGWVSGGR